MKDPSVLQEHGIERIGEREVAQVAVVQAEDRRDPAFDVLPVDQHNEHPIDAVATQALRRRLAGLSDAGFDPELVQLHVPSLGPVRRRRQCVKHLAADIEKTQGDRMDCDGLAHRSEPTFDSAVEWVVVPALIVRLVRLADDAFGGNGEGHEAAAAIATAVGHVCVEAEIVPARGEGWSFGKRRGCQQRAKLVRRRKTEPRRSKLLDDGHSMSGHWPRKPREQHETRTNFRHAIIPVGILRYRGASTSSRRLNRLGPTVTSLYGLPPWHSIFSCPRRCGLRRMETEAQNEERLGRNPTTCQDVIRPPAEEPIGLSGCLPRSRAIRNSRTPARCSGVRPKPERNSGFSAPVSARASNDRG